MILEAFLRQSLADPLRRNKIQSDLTRRERLIADVARMDRRLESDPDSVSEKELRLLESILDWRADAGT